LAEHRCAVWSALLGPLADLAHVFFAVALLARALTLVGLAKVVVDLRRGSAAL
jgi:hypothetical protein